MNEQQKEKLRDNLKKAREIRKQKSGSNDIMERVGKSLDTIMKRLDGFETELEGMKTGKDERFKLEVKSEDVEKGKVDRERIDPKIVKFVDNMLGEDFGIRIKANKDKPGFLITLIVPQRLSLIPKAERPILLEDGRYERDKKGNNVLEEYYPEDPRSRAIATADNYDAIKQHCERIRANIVATYQKLNKPLPQFRLR